MYNGYVRLYLAKFHVDKFVDEVTYNIFDSEY